MVNRIEDGKDRVVDTHSREIVGFEIDVDVGKYHLSDTTILLPQSPILRNYAACCYLLC